AYALFQNMSATFSSANPMAIMKRTTPAEPSLLGNGGEWTTLASGPGDVSAFPGFASGGQYSLQLTLQRTEAASLQITATWMNLGNGATISTTPTDSSAS